jgi:hypothetical protein
MPHHEAADGEASDTGADGQLERKATGVAVIIDSGHAGAAEARVAKAEAVALPLTGTIAEHPDRPAGYRRADMRPAEPATPDGGIERAAPSVFRVARAGVGGRVPTSGVDERPVRRRDRAASHACGEAQAAEGSRQSPAARATEPRWEVLLHR